MNSLDKDAHDVVAEIIPDAGRWKTHTEDTMFDAAKIMLAHGMSYVQTRVVLNNVVGAMIDEYGG